MEKDNSAFFTTLEARIIASLMEKQLTTPNNYPLTLNALILACNQKTNREPVMNLTEGQVGHTVNVLKERGLVHVDFGSRTNHIAHNVMNELNLNKATQAILTVLMMRKPLTLNDIKVRTQRMHEFSDHDTIQQYLTAMMEMDQPLVTCMPKSAGGREDRYTHLLCGEPEIKNTSHQAQAEIGVKVNITQQVKLEERVEKLETKVEQLMKLLN